jgi:hypothetical protein
MLDTCPFHGIETSKPAVALPEAPRPDYLSQRGAVPLFLHQATSGGRLMKIASTFPPLRSPNSVPRS